MYRCFTIKFNYLYLHYNLVGLHTLLFSLKTRIRSLWERDSEEFFREYINKLASLINPWMVRGLATDIITDYREYVKEIVYKGVLEPNEPKPLEILLGKDSILKISSRDKVSVCIYHDSGEWCRSGTSIEYIVGEDGVYRIDIVASRECEVVVKRELSYRSIASVCGELWSIWAPAEWVRRNLAYVPEPIGYKEIKPLELILEDKKGDYDELFILLSSIYIALNIKPYMVLIDLTGNNIPDGVVVGVEYEGGSKNYYRDLESLLKLVGVYDYLLIPYTHYRPVKTSFNDREIIVVDPFHNPPYMPGVLSKDHHSRYRVFEVIDIMDKVKAMK